MSNKIYIIEYKENLLITEEPVRFVIVVAASSKEVATQYVKETTGMIECTTVTWIIGAEYPLIYVRDGSKPKEVQAKILYNVMRY